MYNVYWKEICHCLRRSNVFYGTPYRISNGIFIPITSPRYVQRCGLLYKLLLVQTGLMYLTLLHAWLKGESNNNLLISIGILMYYTTVSNLGLCYLSVDSTRETTVLLNSWVAFQRSLIQYGPFSEGKNISS
jgi:hypothetical protein